MANSYYRCYVHIVFCTKFRQPTLTDTAEKVAYQVMREVIEEENAYLVAMNGLADHVHILIGFRADLRLSDLLRRIKSLSSMRVNKTLAGSTRFQWQPGYYASTVGWRELPIVARYVRNQKLKQSKKYQAWLDRISREMGT